MMQREACNWKKKFPKRSSKKEESYIAGFIDSPITKSNQWSKAGAKMECLMRKGSTFALKWKESERV